ncbi:hypothetical protein CLI85_09470 [Tannerella forsythia]|jgi:hypothetical protein|uniref:Uncharacterized protein n=1 Tax=Tannerella forsythia TaxID=28112 RepID=A0A1D3UCM3_TANFO|nr:hypothetical protein Tanf_09250 [Tannerella forsythia]BAR47751.1 hypothetical protein TF3313_0144 [Tannerella forsythia 3313]OLQ21840.1 hypothetical protein BGK60_00570 [Tannerella forsythia]PDP70445.1 hypothetical protein CLI85_09470 [Tannerella forsythia]TPE17268.1 hypothetical protein FJN16_01260 [Tannerella forsythia]
MLKKILSVSGKPGLYQMVSQGKNMLIIESLTDKKRIPAYARDKVISLGDIAIYTNEKEVPLYEVLSSVKQKENGQKVSIELSKASPDELRAYLAELLPDFDRERVYPTDIKRLLTWYNLLLEAGITEYEPQEEKQEKKEETAETAVEEPKKATPQKTVRAKSTAAASTTAKKQATPKKATAAKTTQRTRQK